MMVVMLLLKNFYANLTQDEKLHNGCTLLKMREQLNIFMNTRPHGNCKAFYSSFKTNLKNSFNTYWHKLLYTDISTSGKEGGNKLRTYRKFKTAIYFEKYLYINNTEKRFSHSDEKSPLWDQVPTEAIWHSKLTLFLNVKIWFYKSFKYKRNKYLSFSSKFQRYNHQNKWAIICHFRRCRDSKIAESC